VLEVVLCCQAVIHDVHAQREVAAGCQAADLAGGDLALGQRAVAVEDTPASTRQRVRMRSQCLGCPLLLVCQLLPCSCAAHAECDVLWPLYTHPGPAEAADIEHALRPLALPSQHQTQTPDPGTQV
jgi:hypothetical protein